MVNRFLVGLIPSLPKALVSRVASRYVAGESIENALRAAEDLNRQGCRVTLAALGEHSDREESQRTLDAYLELLDRIQAAGVDASALISASATCNAWWRKPRAGTASSASTWRIATVPI